MYYKIAIIILFLTHICKGISIISTENLETSTLEVKETTVDPLIILEQFKTLQIQNKQLSNATNVTTTLPSAINNVTNAVSTTVSNVYNRIPCSCVRGQCGCCSGSFLEAFNQKACLNITYEPEEFAFNADLSLNGNVFYRRRVSGRNPPPICFRLPRVQVVRVCGRFSNVYFTGPNMHACIGFEANWEDFQLFESLLNCFRVGAAGVAIVSPEDGGGIGGTTDEDDDDDDDDDDDFDYDDSARGLKNGRNIIEMILH